MNSPKLLHLLILDRIQFMMTLCKSLFPHTNRLFCDKADEGPFTYMASNWTASIFLVAFIFIVEWKRSIFVSRNEGIKLIDPGGWAMSMRWITNREEPHAIRATWRDPYTNNNVNFFITYVSALSMTSNSLRRAHLLLDFRATENVWWNAWMWMVVFVKWCATIESSQRKKRCTEITNYTFAIYENAIFPAS